MPIVAIATLACVPCRDGRSLRRLRRRPRTGKSATGATAAAAFAAFPSPSSRAASSLAPLSSRIKARDAASVVWSARIDASWASSRPTRSPSAARSTSRCTSTGWSCSTGRLSPESVQVHSRTLRSPRRCRYRPKRSLPTASAMLPFTSTQICAFAHAAKGQASKGGSLHSIALEFANFRFCQKPKAAAASVHCCPRAVRSVVTMARSLAVWAPSSLSESAQL